METIILASGSPRRQELLAKVRIPFKAFPPNIPEELDHIPDISERVRQIALKLPRQMILNPGGHHRRTLAAQHHLIQIPVLVRVPEDIAVGVIFRLGGDPAGKLAVSVLLGRAQSVLDRGPDRLILIFEMEVKRPAAKIRPVGDVLDGHPLIPLFQYQRDSRLD